MSGIHLPAEAMAKDANTTLSHVYGIAGLVPGLIGLVFLFNANAGWRDYALLFSGWAVAVVFGVMLWRAFTQARQDGEAVGTLTEKVRALEKELDACVKNHAAELDRRQATQDYLAAQLMGQQAMPRAKPRAHVAGDAEDEQ